jgi:uncharacterized SAM-binding protein YcdF (DUF218 family)
VSLTQLIERLIVPPGGPLLLILLGLLWVRRPRRALMLAGTGLTLLYLSSTGLVAGGLLSVLESRYPPLAQLPPQAEAIVVLAAGRNYSTPEFGGDTVNAMWLERLRYAALLQRRSGLPLLVTGGSPPTESPSVAELAAPVLEQELGIPVAWYETKSLNTYENALYSKRLLESEGIGRVIVVTHAMHMPRAMWSFREVGLEAWAAPTAFESAGKPLGLLNQLIPKAESMSATRYALHELIGGLFYRLAY